MKVMIERLPEIDCNLDNINSSVLGFGFALIVSLLLVSAQSEQKKALEPSWLFKLYSLPHFSHIIPLI